jgi:proline racemase
MGELERLVAIGEIETVDYHTAGEPFRVVAEPPVAIEGGTVADRRQFAMGDSTVDGLRRLLCSEPRGHADMYGGFIVPPDDDGAHFGVLFWHKDGFSTACGHGTIALGTWAVHHGVVPVDPSGVTDVRIDVPSGRVTARVHTVDEPVWSEGRGDHRPTVARVDFINVASYTLARHVEVETDFGRLVVDVAFGGAAYAHLDASTVGLSVTAEHYTELIAVGRAVKAALAGSDVSRHPTDDRLSGIYGTIIYEDLGLTADGRAHQRNVTVFADGEVDRSPCGSGTASRLAVLADDGVVGVGGGPELLHDSIVDTSFVGTVLEKTAVDGRPAYIPQVTGSAFRTGQHRFELDPDDPVGLGFVLR